MDKEEVNTSATSNPMSVDDERIIQYKVPFSEAALRYLKGWTSKGRSSRSEFWWALLFSLIVDWGVDGVIGATVIYKAFAIAIFVLDVYLWWRRMQDIGKSGWWSIVPGYNLYLATRPSEMAVNKFGPIPNTSPIIEKPIARKTIFGVLGASIIAAWIGGCVGDDSPEDAFYRMTEGIREKNAEMFFSNVYIEGMTVEKLEANKDMANMMFEKLMQELKPRNESESQYMKVFEEPKILDVIETDDEVYVKFTAKDSDVRAMFESEGVAGMMMKAVATDDGWKMCFDQMRPVIASEQETNAAKAKMGAIEAKAAKKAETAQKARDAEELKAAVAKGRNLFTAMSAANVEREALGLPNVYPHLNEDDGLLSDKKEDIAGNTFNSSTAYFNVLFDTKNIKKGDWSPYVSGIGIDALLLQGEKPTWDWGGNNVNVDWMVMAGVTEDFPDSFPILISSNIEASYLTLSAGEKDFSRDGRNIPLSSTGWMNSFVVVVRKGGSVDVIDKDDCKMQTLFKAKTINLPHAVRCLAP